MNDLKTMSINTSIKFSDDSFSDDRYIKGRIKVMHNGLNPNDSFFRDENIEKAKDTLSNIFVLANVVEVEEGKFDFGAHDYRLELNKIDKETFKIVYEELPIGIIPETNSYEYKLDEESGRNYVWVDCLIVRDYSNYAEDIVRRYIEEEKDIKISMEIAVDEYDYNKDEDYFDVISYRYTAITMLGERFGTGMVGAKAEFYTPEEKRLEFEKKALEVGMLFSSNLEKNKKEGCQTMALTFKQKMQLLNNSIEDDKVFDGEELVSNIDYWVSDADEDYVYVERYFWNKENGWSEDFVRGTYTISEDEETATVNKDSFEVLTKEYLTQAEKDLIDAERSKEFEEKINELNSKIEDLNSSLESKQSEFDAKQLELDEKKVELENVNTLLEETKSEYAQEKEALDTELSTLRSYKANIEHEVHKAKIDDVIVSFNEKLSESEEFETLKQDAYNMTVEEVTNACFIIVGKLNHEFSSNSEQVKNKSFARLDLEDVGNDNSEESKKYGEMAKYIKKDK